MTLWYQLAGAGLLGTAVGIGSGQAAVHPPPTLLTSLVYQTLVISGASYLAWLALLRSYLASRLGVPSLLTPMLGIGFGVLVLHDRLTSPFLFGALIILAGILLVNARDLLARGRRCASTLPIPTNASRSCS